jgi:hypothetical protein
MPPLRVALLLDDWRVPRWIARIAERIQESPHARVVLVVKNTSPRDDEPRHPLYRAYTRLDDLVFRRRAAIDVLAETDLGPLVADCPVIEVAPDFPEAAARAVAAHDLDVALRFGFPRLGRHAPELARHGVWSYDHTGPLGGFWEVLEARPTTPSTLRVLGPGDGRVIYRSWASTDHHSVARNRQNNLAKSAEFVLRKLRDLQAEGAAALAASAPPQPDPAPRRPTTVALARGLARLGARYTHEKWLQLRRGEQWILAWDRSSGPDHRFQYLLPPPDGFWADPFPVAHDGVVYVFFEEYSHRRHRGRISCLRMTDDGPQAAPETVLEAESHLSYPCVFRWRGDWYMVPETGARRTIELYRAARFPDRWEPAGVLFDHVAAADTTVAEIDGRWWMFTCMAVDGALASDELFLFHADSPLGPWRPHRRNPVKSDVRSARPAGRLIKAEDGWYRPAQDCSGRYGRAIVMNRIERLTPDDYVETDARRLEPDWDPRIVATHTFNQAGGLTFVDALRLR